jgi:hypothetical protein
MNTKTDELVISEEYRYYVTRAGKLAVLMCDLTKVPVDVPFDMLDGKESFIVLYPHSGDTLDFTSVYKSGRLSLRAESKDDIVGCLYFADGYQEAIGELKNPVIHRQFVCTDASDVVGAIYYPITGMASWFGVNNEISQTGNGHLLARSIAQSIACGDGKWMEATAQSLQSRREAVKRRIQEREEFPQYWTTVEVDPHCPTAFVVRHDLDNWSIHYKNGQTLDLKLNQFVSEGRTRLTKEQAEALLDQKEKFPQYWTSNNDQIAYMTRTGPGEYDWKLVRKNGTEGPVVFPSYTANRTRLTKEQAEALLDKPKAKCSRDRVAELLYEVKMLAEGDCRYVSGQLSDLAKILNR